MFGMRCTLTRQADRRLGSCRLVIGERAFAGAAAADGVALERARVPWLNERGHFGLPAEAAEAVAVLDRIFDALGGLVDEQRAKRLTSLPGDFLHEPSGTFVEVDESQHFTSWRLRSLDLYPPGTPLGFDLDEYRNLCAHWAPKSDRYRAAKSAVGFGDGGTTASPFPSPTPDADVFAGGPHCKCSRHSSSPRPPPSASSRSSTTRLRTTKDTST